ncbi:hypothetical protein [Natrinema thermotolerans]
MQDQQDRMTRRSMLASGASFASGGLLLTGSVAGAQGQTSRADGEANGAKGDGEANVAKDLTDAVTVANGKAKVKGWAKSSGRGDVTFSISGEESVTYTAREFANHINEGVRKGYWTVRKRAGELDFDLTEKGRELFSADKNRGLQTLSHCNGRNEKDGGTIYLDDSSWEEIVFGGYATAGVLEIAAAIAGLIYGLSVGPIVLAAAGVIAGLTALRLSQVNEGCGAKVDSNSLSAQHCDC